MALALESRLLSLEKEIALLRALLPPETAPSLDSKKMVLLVDPIHPCEDPVTFGNRSSIPPSFVPVFADNSIRSAREKITEDFDAISCFFEKVVVVSSSVPLTLTELSGGPTEYSSPQAFKANFRTDAVSYLDVSRSTCCPQNSDTVLSASDALDD